VGSDEADVYAQQYEKDGVHISAMLPAAVHRVHGYRQEEGGPAVEAVVKQLTEGRARACTPGLFTIYTI